MKNLKIGHVLAAIRDGVVETKQWWDSFRTITVRCGKRTAKCKRVRNDAVMNGIIHNSGVIISGMSFVGVGYMLITDDFFEELTPNTQRFAIAHEIGHMMAGHCRRYFANGITKMLGGMANADVVMDNRNLHDEYVADQMGVRKVGTENAIRALEEMLALVKAINRDMVEYAEESDPSIVSEIERRARHSEHEFDLRIRRIKAMRRQAA